MRRRQSLLPLIFVVLLVELARHESVQATEDSAKRPNVVLIMLDQLRYDVLGFVQAQMPRYKNKLHVRTPNIDRLATQLGTVFETNYCAVPLCAPARTSFMTGCTIQRTGIVGNKGMEPDLYTLMSYFQERVEALVSVEQIVAEDLGYTVESYGKNHYPHTLLNGYKDKSKRVITYNDFDFATETPGFMYAEAFMRPYRKALQYLLPLDDTVDTSYVNGSQKSFFSELPYIPIRIDPRYGYPTNTPLDVQHGIPSYYDICEENYEFGRDTLPEKYTSTAVLGEMVLKAFDRLVEGKKPFFLEFQINSPHPPRIACSAFLDYYWDRRYDLLVQPSLNDPMMDSAYKYYMERHIMEWEGDKYRFNNASLMAELTAVYYAMVEEADVWVGKLLDRIYESGIENQTLILFTSDHGELLGAHSMLGKLILLEESVRVPLILSFPGRIPQGATVQNFVSHLDVHATILDYIGAPNVHLNQSDGKTLRRFIEELSFNEEYDENFVVVESDLREPINEKQLSNGELGGKPNFMIRKGRYKLMVPKKASSTVLDMMYDLELDPFEMDNLLGRVGENASDAIIGKAEHLKILLLEWMSRMDGSKQYYSSNKYNNNEGLGSIQEVALRRTWRSVNYWQSENTTLLFQRPCQNKEGVFVRNEYLYIGRTLAQPDDLIVDEIAVGGPDAKFFSVDVTQVRIAKTGHIRIKVSFTATELLEFQSLTAWIRIHSNVAGLRKILIHVADAPSVVPTAVPTVVPSVNPVCPSVNPVYPSVTPSDASCPSVPKMITLTKIKTVFGINVGKSGAML